MDREKKLYAILPSIHMIMDKIKQLLRKDLLTWSKLENISMERMGQNPYSLS